MLHYIFLFPLYIQLNMAFEDIWAASHHCSIANRETVWELSIFVDYTSTYARALQREGYNYV